MFVLHVPFRDAMLHRPEGSLDLGSLSLVPLLEHRQKDDPPAVGDVVGDPYRIALRAYVEPQFPKLPM
jgi:hypothetical protein